MLYFYCKKNKVFPPPPANTSAGTQFLAAAADFKHIYKVLNHPLYVLITLAVSHEPGHLELKLQFSP